MFLMLKVMCFFIYVFYVLFVFQTILFLLFASYIFQDIEKRDKELPCKYW